MSRQSTVDLLVLHAVRLKGFAETVALAQRFGLDLVQTDLALRGHQRRGLIGYTEFAGTGGWSLTESGRSENEHQLAAELAGTGAADVVHRVYADFIPLNHLLCQACTAWQLRPMPENPLTANDHTNLAWDAAVIDDLAVVDRALPSIVDRLASVLARFGGYDRRFSAALARARAGKVTWVDGADVDSCHRVWFELHEDLVATLGVGRGTESDPTSGHGRSGR